MVLLHSFLTSALDGGDWSAARPGRFSSGNGVRIPVEKEAEWTRKLHILKVMMLQDILNVNFIFSFSYDIRRHDNVSNM